MKSGPIRIALVRYLLLTASWIVPIIPVTWFVPSFLLATTSWWMKFLDDTQAGDQHLLCYGFRRGQQHKFEIVTAEDRVRRQAKRVRKAVTRVAAQVGQTADGLQALEAILAAAKARLGK